MVARWTLNPLLVGSNPPSSARERSSAWLEHLPFKQRVESSNLSAPIRRTVCVGCMQPDCLYGGICWMEKK